MTMRGTLRSPLLRLKQKQICAVSIPHLLQTVMGAHILMYYLQPANHGNHRSLKAGPTSLLTRAGH